LETLPEVVGKLFGHRGVVPTNSFRSYWKLIWIQRRSSHELIWKLLKTPFEVVGNFSENRGGSPTKFSRTCWKLLWKLLETSLNTEEVFPWNYLELVENSSRSFWKILRTQSRSSHKLLWNRDKTLSNCTLYFAWMFDSDACSMHSLYHWKGISEIYNFKVIWFEKSLTNCSHFSILKSGTPSKVP